MINILFFLGMVAIPFSGVWGLSYLGETHGELSVYFFLPAMLLAFPLYVLKPLPSPGIKPFRLLNKASLAFFALVSFSFIVNFLSLVEASYLGRSGVEKFFSSMAMAIYGFSLAYLSCSISQEKWGSLIIKPIVVSAVVCVFFSIFEVVAWYSDALAEIVKALSSVIHSGVKIGFLRERLRSVSYEPPAFAAYAAFVWPWLYAVARNSRGYKRVLYHSLWIIINIMIVLAVSRTGILTLAGNFFTLFALRYIYLAAKPKHKTLKTAFSVTVISIIVVFMAIITLHFESLKQAVIHGDSVSNLSRLASNTAAFNMFIDRPLTGFGFGQYGFNASKFMPSWGYLSYEIRAWFTRGGISAAWPPVFSLYARFGAELGILGLALWVGIWIGLANLIIRYSLELQKRTSVIPFQSMPLIANCVCVLLVGVSNDSLRLPMMWIALGLGCRFVQEMQYKLSLSSRESSSNKEFIISGKQVAFSLCS